MYVMSPSATDELALFRTGLVWHDSWQHLNRRLAQGALKNLAFKSFHGVEHLAKLYAWIAGFRYPNFIGGIHVTRRRNKKIDADGCSLGLKGHDHQIDSVSLYNAKNYYLQHAYPVPKRY
jgi:hypothetical protein